MSFLPPALNFAETEEDICKKWKEEDSFLQQNRLSLERGDEVSRTSAIRCMVIALFETQN
jgi:hypothetical protein